MIVLEIVLFGKIKKAGTAGHSKMPASILPFVGLHCTKHIACSKARYSISHSTIKDPQWYAVQGSDTTMIPHSCFFAGTTIFLLTVRN